MIRKIAQPVFLMAAAALSVFAARAQTLPDPVSLIPSSQSPSPGSEVTIEASTPTFDLYGATFRWTVNGTYRQDLSGLGKNAITLIAGDTGSTLQVAAAVSRPGAAGGNAQITLRVSDLALTWFAETSVPKWYKGKALPVANAIVNIVAVPQIVIRGVPVKPERLIYRWTLDDEDNVLVGAGKQTLRLRVTDLPKTTHHVKVRVEDIEREVSGKAEVFIIPGSPKAVVYAATPLGGIEPRVAPLYYTLRKITDFQAEPFFFPQRKQELSYEWTAGGETIAAANGTDPENPWIITVEKAAREIANTVLAITVKSGGELPMTASKGITLSSE